MRLAPRTVLACLALECAAVALHAQTATQLAVPDVTANYSHAVDVAIRLTRATDHTGVQGAQVNVLLRPVAGSFSLDVGQVPTGSDGTASVRIPLVNGCALFGGHALQGGTAAAPVDYILEASFPGDNLSGTPYTGSTASGTLHVVKDNVQVIIVSGTSGELGDTLVLTAKIEDPDGDAPCDRSALTGPTPVVVEGHRLAFFWDSNHDGDYSDQGESLGSAVTARPNPDTDPTATVPLDTTPHQNQPRAGTWDGALQVQLPADDTLYLPATAVGRLVLLPAPVAADRTTLVADPASPQAGSSAVEITITLRDKFDNPLDGDAPEHVVALAIEGTAYGAIVQGSQATRDAASGLYKQTLLSATRKGKVTVRASVDGTAGSALEIAFSGVFPVGPCRCATPASSWPGMGGLVALCALARRRRGKAP